MNHPIWGLISGWAPTLEGFVICVDIRNSTETLRQFGRQKFAQDMGDFCRRSARAVRRVGGTPINFTGDGVLLFVPSKVENAQEIFQEILRLSPYKAAVGVSWGTLERIGFQGHWVGDPIVEASRLSGGDAGEIWCTQEALTRSECAPMAHKEVKNSIRGFLI
jgi:class 3 adenylate cyclase